MPWISKAAAALAIAASLLVLYVGLSAITGGAPAFADIVDALNKVRTATWKSTTEFTLPGNETRTNSSNGMFLAPSHERNETTETTAEGTKATDVMIMDGQKDKVLTLVPATKTAIVIDLKNKPPGMEGPFGHTFQDLRELAAEAQSGKRGKVERLGVKTVDGQTAEGFRIQLGSTEATIWAAPKTLLPVRVEYRYSNPTNPGGSTVMTDFRVNVPLDESLFSLDVPPGYTVQQTMQIDLSKNPIYYLADTLKLVAEVNGGVFPPELRGDNGIDGILQRSQKQLKQSGEKMAAEAGKASPENAMKSATQLSMNLGATFGFLNALSPASDWHYAGRGVKLNTPDRPIFWYKRNVASKTYCVLYADLTVKEVPANERPTAPATAGGDAGQ
jgi:outer membrane lipoprotein-sorting protein